MTIKELREYLNKLDEKHDDYPIFTFQEEELKVDGITYPNFGELTSKEDGKVTPFFVLTTRTVGDLGKKYNLMIKAIAFKIG